MVASHFEVLTCSQWTKITECCIYFWFSLSNVPPPTVSPDCHIREPLTPHITLPPIPGQPYRGQSITHVGAIVDLHSFIDMDAKTTYNSRPVRSEYGSGDFSFQTMNAMSWKIKENWNTFLDLGWNVYTDIYGKTLEWNSFWGMLGS